MRMTNLKPPFRLSVDALRIHMDEGNRAATAGTLHQLGMVSQFQGEPERALDFYVRALEMEEGDATLVHGLAPGHNSWVA